MGECNGDLFGVGLLLIMLRQQSSHSGRIIIQDYEEEEEAQAFAPSVSPHSPALQITGKISSISLNGYKISALLLTLLSLACLTLLYQYYALKSEL